MASPNNPFEFFDELSKPIWYYEKTDLKKSPSFEDGIPSETEARYRSEGPKFIQEVGKYLELNYLTVATASVYFHRFYMKHSFKKFHRYVVATCCLFVAGKVEETPKKCKDLMKAAKANLAENQWAHFGEYPRDEVMTLEKVLLHSIQFDFQVEHPYKYLLKYVKALKAAPQDKIKNMMQMAWTFVNDSLSTTLCLLWEPQIIAVAVMHLSGRLNKFAAADWATNHQGKWWEKFVPGVGKDILDEICHKILDQYSGKGGMGGKKAGDSGKRERPKTPREGEPQQKLQRVQQEVKNTPTKVKKQQLQQQQGKNMQQQVKQENNNVAKKQVSRVISSITPAKPPQQQQTPVKPQVVQQIKSQYESKPIETIGSRTNSVSEQDNNSMQGSYNNNPSSFPTNMTSQQLNMTSSRPPLPSPYPPQPQQQQNPPLPPTQHQQSFPTAHPSTTILPPPPQFAPQPQQTMVTSYNHVMQPSVTSQYIQQPPQPVTMTNYMPPQVQVPQNYAPSVGYQGQYGQVPPSGQFQQRNRGRGRGGRGKSNGGGWQSMM